MNNNESNSDNLVQYLDNELSQEDKTNIKNQLKHDTVMQQELENLSLAKSAIKIYGLKQHVRIIHKEMMNEIVVEKSSPTKKGVIRRLVSMKVAAAAVLFVMLGLGVYQYTTVTTDKLFASNYKPYTLSVNRGVVEINVIEQLFQEKKYNSVITQFEILKETSPKENFLAGVSYLEMANYKNAITALNKVLAKNIMDKTNIFNDDAEYFLALSYLKNTDVALASPIFKTIHNNTNHLYNDRVNNAFMRNLRIINWKY
jgi:tetratricopeptide (TPR) repeat protein